MTKLSNKPNIGTGRSASLVSGNENRSRTFRILSRSIPLLLLTAFLCASLSSCKLGKKYVRPELNLPQTYNLPTDTFSIGELAWWDIFGDTLLQKLITKALNYNKDLLMAQARVKELAALKRIPFADFFPQVNVGLYAEREGLNYGGDHFKNDPEWGAKLNASWELDIWGKLCWAKDQSDAQWLEVVNNERSVMVSVITDVAIAYIQLIALDRELEIVSQTLEARKEGLRIAKLRYEAGLTSEMSYQQARVEYARTATLVPVIQQNIQVKEGQISMLAGDYPTTIERATTFDLPSWNDTLIPAGLPSSLLQRRPDIRAAEQKLIAANASVGIAYTNRFPTLTLSGNAGFEFEYIDQFLKSPAFLMRGAITGPVFDMGKRQASYRAKQAAYERETYNYEKTVLSAFTEVRNAIVYLNNVKEIYTTRAKLEEASKTTESLARLQYINGVIAYLDLLDAQRSYLDAQLSLSNAQRDKALALVMLYKALGGGWQ